MILPAVLFQKEIVDYNATTKQYQQSLIEIKDAMGLGVGRNDVVDVGRSEKIDYQQCWFDEAVTAVGGKGWVTDFIGRNKVGFECLDYAFCMVGTQVTWESDFNVEFSISDGTYDVSGDFITKAEEANGESTILEFLITMFGCADVLFGFVGAYGFGLYVIGILVVKDKHIFVVAGRVDWVASSGVYGDEILHIFPTKETDTAVEDFAAWFKMIMVFWLVALNVLFDHLKMVKVLFFVVVQNLRIYLEV